MDLLLMNLCNFLMKLINTLFMLICSESNNVLLSRRSVNNTLKNLSSRWLTYFSKVILFSSCVFSVYLPMTLSQFHYFSIFQGCDRLLNKTMSHERKAWKLESVKACGYKAFYTFFVCFESPFSAIWGVPYGLIFICLWIWSKFVKYNRQIIFTYIIILSFFWWGLKKTTDFQLKTKKSHPWSFKIP